MISLLVLAFCLVAPSAATLDPPDCSNCPYENGIGFVADDGYCAVYFMCIKDLLITDEYTYEKMCCAEGQTFDMEHKTCVPVKAGDDCDPNRVHCPEIITTYEDVCRYQPDPADDTKFLTYNGIRLMCPYGEIWNQENCTCIRGPNFVPNDNCTKILSYQFAGTYNSYSCYNFAVGEPYNMPSLAGDVLCLNGKDQFVSIPFLNNWFAWNPVGKSFSLCFDFFPNDGNANQGIVSTNCKYLTEGSIAEFWLTNGELMILLEDTVFATGQFPVVGDWNSVCVAFDAGTYYIYFNGNLIGVENRSPMPVNSMSATTLGFVDGMDLFFGYIDNFCFYTENIY